MSLSINQRLAEIIYRGKQLCETTFCGQEPGFAKLLDELRAIQRQALAVPACAQSPKARGTINEIAIYCQEIGLTVLDAGWFFDKCEGCGWKNNKQPIADWKATVRAWKAIAVFPSQKQGFSSRNGDCGNGHQPVAVAGNAPIDRMIAMKEFERVEKKIENLRLSYTGMQTWREDDRVEIKRLKGRKLVLMKQLGMEV